jgi:hypothetical protein
MKNAVFWDVAPCISCVNRRFGGTYRLHFQGRKIRERGTIVGRWGNLFSGYQRFDETYCLYLHWSLRKVRKKFFFSEFLLWLGRVCYFTTWVYVAGQRPVSRSASANSFITINIYECPVISSLHLLQFYGASYRQIRSFLYVSEFTH